MIRRFILLLLAIAAALASTAPARADDFRPAYLQLEQTGPDSYDVLWKVPAIDEYRTLKVRPVYPPGTSIVEPLKSTFSGNTTAMSGRIAIPGGLPGKQLRFEGLAETRGEVLVRLIRLDGTEELSKVSSNNPQLAIAIQPGSIGISARYTGLGIEHILLGFDHLLFVAALVMLVANVRMLVWTVTSFTLAHSITLALVTLGVIIVPVPPVEAFIALSIMFVAVEIVRQRQGQPSLASRKPWLVAFAFGLLHGLGFASALTEIGLPQNNIPLALLFFNIGVELGQMVFVAALLALVAVGRRYATLAQLRRTAIASSYAIGGLASYWLIERIAAFT
jgi:hypothetical protein